MTKLRKGDRVRVTLPDSLWQGHAGTVDHIQDTHVRVTFVSGLSNWYRPMDLEKLS